MEQLCQRLKGLLKADNVKWVAAVRVLKDETFKSDSMRGWRLRAKYDLVPDGEAYEKLIRVMFERNDPADSKFNVGHATVGIIKRMGKFQAHRMRDGWIPYEEFAATILRGIRGFHRRLFMERALLIRDKPLSPVARRVLQKLLKGISEKEIAESLGQSVTTTHRYVKTIYARFGVNARAALMSLWLQH